MVGADQQPFTLAFKRQIPALAAKLEKKQRHLTEQVASAFRNDVFIALRAIS